MARSLQRMAHRPDLNQCRSKRHAGVTSAGCCHLSSIYGPGRSLRGHFYQERALGDQLALSLVRPSILLLMCLQSLILEIINNRKLDLLKQFSF